MTIFGFLSWLLTKPETWLYQGRIQKMKEEAVVEMMGDDKDGQGKV